jgi:quercetin dioxygenase-like cupin family protein
MDIHLYARNEGPAVWFLNTLTFIKATGQQTGGAFGLIEQLAPVGAGSPYHVHRVEDETFYILDGKLEFISGDRRFTGETGACIFLPKNIPHGFRVVGSSPSRFLVLATPGGFEGFIAEAGEPARELVLPVPSAPDMGKLVPLAAKYSIEILGPLPE